VGLQVCADLATVGVGIDNAGSSVGVGVPWGDEQELTGNNAKRNSEVF
jgi:hypothetical protein